MPPPSNPKSLAARRPGTHIDASCSSTFASKCRLFCGCLALDGEGKGEGEGEGDGEGKGEGEGEVAVAAAAAVVRALGRGEVSRRLRAIVLNFFLPPTRRGWPWPRAGW